MQRQSKLFRLLGIGLSLWLFAIPTAGVWGQDVPTDGVGEEVEAVEVEAVEVEAVEVPDTPGAAASPEVVALDPALLTHRVFLPTIQGSNQTESLTKDNEVAAANFSKTWTANPCVNVTTAERGLWDDMPGPGGANNEAGLFWFVTNSAADENCAHASVIANLPTGPTAVSQLLVRVAVSDGALFSTTIYRRGLLNLCLPWLTTTTAANADDSQFRTLSLALPVGSTICSVQIKLDDDANAIATGRASALIDYIQLRNSGAIFWQEAF